MTCKYTLNARCPPLSDRLIQVPSSATSFWAHQRVTRPHDSINVSVDTAETLHSPVPCSVWWRKLEEECTDDGSSVSWVRSHRSSSSADMLNPFCAVLAWFFPYFSFWISFSGPMAVQQPFHSRRSSLCWHFGSVSQLLWYSLALTSAFDVQ